MEKDFIRGARALTHDSLTLPAGSVCEGETVSAEGQNWRCRGVYSSLRDVWMVRCVKVLLLRLINAAAFFALTDQEWMYVNGRRPGKDGGEKRGGVEVVKYAENKKRQKKSVGCTTSLGTIGGKGVEESEILEKDSTYGNSNCIGPMKPSTDASVAKKGMEGQGGRVEKGKKREWGWGGG